MRGKKYRKISVAIICTKKEITKEKKKEEEEKSFDKNDK